MSRNWEDVKAERPIDPEGLAKAKAEFQARQDEYDGYLEVLGITDDSPEGDEFNRRMREFEDGYGMPLDAAYRMAYLEMRVENLMDENAVLRSKLHPQPKIPMDQLMNELGVNDDDHR